MQTLLTLALLSSLTLTSLSAVGTAFFPQSVASGDPEADSVILWTRLVDGDTNEDQQVSLKVTTTGNLEIVGTTEELIGTNIYTGGLLTAVGAHDGCVKMRLSGLAANMTYYYQFAYNDGGSTRYSAIGRTKTAPSPADEVDVQFAVFNCSDYSGRYYNTLKHLVDQESETVDFVLHLGDYIYETTVDPSFQTVDPNRLISFTDTAGAIDFGDFFAAKSLSNYRELYKTYREDPNLIAAHERFPWVVIWDDHEYSDDAFGATATFFDGKIDENDPVRKRDAEQAWLEFVPSRLGLNDSGSALEIAEGDLFPNLEIFRALNFGAHLELILTDNRAKRVDHLIPEDAFPGTMAMNQDKVRTTLSALGNSSTEIDRTVQSLDPYFDVDASNSYFSVPASDYSATGHPAFTDTPFAGLTFKEALIAITQQAAATELATTPTTVLDPAEISARSLGYATTQVAGDLSATWVNILFQAAGFPAPFDTTTLNAMPRGLSFQLFGKASNYIDTGSRYQVINSTFSLYAFHLFLTEGRDGAFYDSAQQTFLAQALAGSASQWKVVGSSSPFTPIRLNLATPEAAAALPNKGSFGGGPTQSFPFPEQFKQDFLVNADEVAGFPVFRQDIVDLLAANDAVLVSGDIHASMLGSNLAQNGEKVIDFTAPSTSSSNFRRAFSSAITTIEGLIGAQAGVPFVFDQGQVETFLNQVDTVVVDSSPELDYLNTETHGYLLVDATASALRAEFREIDTTNVKVDHRALDIEGIDAIFTRKPYTLKKVANDLAVTANPVVIALAKTNAIKVGERIVIPNVLTSASQQYRVTYSSSLTSPFSPVLAKDLVAANGAPVENGVITGNGGTIAVIVKIPQALASEQTGFFRVETVPAP